MGLKEKKGEAKTGESEAETEIKENVELRVQTEETNGSSGEGEENNDRIRARNRHYKIKRYMLQPRNTDVRYNGRVVRRMVVRRQTLCPSTRR